MGETGKGSEGGIEGESTNGKEGQMEYGRKKIEETLINGGRMGRRWDKGK